MALDGKWESIATVRAQLGSVVLLTLVRPADRDSAASGTSQPFATGLLMRSGRKRKRSDETTKGDETSEAEKVIETA